MKAETLGGRGKRRVIIALSNRGLQELLSTLSQSTEAVLGIRNGQVTMLQRALTATGSGIAVIGSERRGYRLRFPKDVLVEIARPIVDVSLHEYPLAGTIPRVIFRYGDQVGNQDG